MIIPESSAGLIRPGAVLPVCFGGLVVVAVLVEPPSDAVPVALMGFLEWVETNVGAADVLLTVAVTTTLAEAALPEPVSDGIPVADWGISWMLFEVEPKEAWAMPTSFAERS
jgi:hypothetical protein